MIAYGGIFLILIREIKIPPHICHGIGFVVDDLITWCVVCCAKCHFHPFLPFSSITMPRYWKMLPVAKTPENSTLRAYRLIMRINPILQAFFFRLLRSSRNFTTVSISQYSDTRVHITHCIIFGKPYLLLPVNTIYHHSKHNLLNYPYYTNYSITYSLQLYRYLNTDTTMQYIVTIL